MKYEIKTLEDIFKAVTKENVDRFLVDFGEMLRQRFAMQDLQDALCDAMNYKRGPIKSERFVWIDDGKHENTTTINFEDGSKIEISNKPKDECYP